MKHLLWMASFSLLLLMAAAVLWAALPATDAFTSTNGTTLTTYSSSWSLNSGDFAINTNAVYPNQSGAEGGARWNADTFGNDQYAQGKLANITTTGQTIGVAVRASTGGAASYYGFYADGSGGGKTFLFKMVSGTWTQLGSTGAALSANDLLRLEISGTTLTPKVNGSTQSPPGTQTDSALSSGAAGLSGYSLSTAMRLDDWEGGNLAGTPVMPRSRRMIISSLGREFPGGARNKLAVLRWFGPRAVQAQATFSRFYVVPVVGTGADHTDGRRPKYFEVLSAPWSAMDYGAEPVMLVRAEVTSALDAILTANADVFALPVNLDVNLTNAEVATVRAVLETANIPVSNWVTTSVTWRQLLRTVAQMMQFLQRLSAVQGSTRLFGSTVLLSTRWNQLNAAQQSALIQAASSMGFSIAAFTGSSNFRTMLKAMADQWGNRPVVIGGSQL